MTMWHEYECWLFQALDPSYGMYVWPSAPVLAQYVWYHQDIIHNKHVIEVAKYWKCDLLSFDKRGVKYCTCINIYLELIIAQSRTTT